MSAKGQCKEQCAPVCQDQTPKCCPDPCAPPPCQDPCTVVQDPCCKQKGLAGQAGLGGFAGGLGGGLGYGKK